MSKEQIVAVAILVGKAAAGAFVLGVEQRLGKTRYGSILGVIGALFKRPLLAKEISVEQDLVKGPIGSVANYEVEIVNGMIVGKASTNQGPSDIGYVKVESGLSALVVLKALVKKVEDAIPGEYDNLILDTAMKYISDALQK